MPKSARRPVPRRVGGSPFVLALFGSLILAIGAACNATAPGGLIPSPGVGSPTAGGEPAGDCQHGMVCAPALAADLISIPLPDSAEEFSVPSGGPNDPRGSSRQSVFYTATPAEIQAFYASALPSAGFEIVSTEVSADYNVFEVVTPDGHEGRLIIRPAVPPHGAQMSIELFMYR